MGSFTAGSTTAGSTPDNTHSLHRNFFVLHANNLDFFIRKKTFLALQWYHICRNMYKHNYFYKRVIMKKKSVKMGTNSPFS